MPRAGAGGGGSHSSGGHHVGGGSSHSSGGHRVGGGPGMGGGSRPGGGFGGSHGPGGHGSGGHGPGGPGLGGGFGGPRPGGGFGGPMMPPPRGGRHGHYHGGCLGTMLAMCLVVIFIVATGISCSARTVSGLFGGSSSSSTSATKVTSTTTREKLDSSAKFDSNCIVDELGWFDNAKSAGKNLETFYNLTGVQPYVVLLDYDSSLSSDAAKDNYANKYFNENIGNEDAFLYVYFAEEDSDEDVGYMSYVCGNNALAVMDSEAIEIFWDNIDEYWYSDLSTDKLFETVFSNTANSIMGKSGSTSSGVFGKILKYLACAVIAAIVVVVLYRINSKKEASKKDASKTSSTVGEKNPNILN